MGGSLGHDPGISERGLPIGQNGDIGVQPHRTGYGVGPPSVGHPDVAALVDIGVIADDIGEADGVPPLDIAQNCISA